MTSLSDQKSEPLSDQKSEQNPVSQGNSSSLIFVVMGMLTLASWNFYLTGLGFFIGKFPGYQFAFIASMTYQTANLIGTSAMVKIGHKLPFKVMYVVSLTVQCIAILTLPMLAYWSGYSQDEPSLWGFCCALGCCGIIGIAEAIFASLAFGLAGSIGEQPMAAMMSGMGWIGVLTPILMLSLKFLSGDLIGWKYEVVFGYFGCCVALQLMGLCIVNRIPSMPVSVAQQEFGSFGPQIGSRVEATSKSFTLEPAPSVELLNHVDGRTLEAGGIRQVREIFKDALPQLVNICMIFIVTFIVFPGVASKWRSELPFFSSNADWYTTCIIGIFQVFDVVGRISPGFLISLRVTAKSLWIPSSLRFIFVPLFMVLQRFPHLLPSLYQDLAQALAMAAFAVSNGWCATLAMMHGPQQVSIPAEQHTVGIMMELGLITGIFAGSLLALTTQIGLS
eukprot:gnl/MRDRNA2_/MRDRNA2_212477_c0_seq1.p1 gnl/MRDRNA2_/MRDRNA2_212477_c0~~gnl/MRDRNA2_/MRDRNA2_212477_c0_seq1.p1  ORF type:complete len:448 (+),score=64.13 gnl/MRDRNA2_/MRDRNA2_212477_c0_seq1:61-1404(+)